jgi:hypothetical protein
MSRFLRRVPLVGLVFVVFLLACGKGEKTSAPEKPTEPAASAAPTPAPRDTEMKKVEMPVSGAVKDVAAKVLDKEAGDKAKGLIKVKTFEGGIDVNDFTKVQVWRPGADTEEARPETEGWANRDIEVAPGAWDLRLRYDEGTLCRADGWIRGVAVEAGKLWKAEATLAAPMQYVRIGATLDGKDTADNTKVYVYRAGADMEEQKPLHEFWTTRKEAVAAGTYDLRLRYEKDKVTAKKVLKGFAVGGDHGVKKETIVLEK